MKLLSYGYKILKSDILPSFTGNYHSTPKLLRAAKKSAPLNCRSFSHNYQDNRKLPDLLYFPHVFRWLNVKYRLRSLKNTWDPEFSEGAFIYGTTRAICKVTEVISSDKPDNLKNLVEERVEQKLTLDMRTILSEHQKRAIRLKPEDIKLLVPMKVNFVSKAGEKHCHILLKTLAMKWFQLGTSTKLALIVLETEFSRDYTHGTNSEWLITLFNVLQCSLVNSTRPS